jgi:hypothetical protein
MAIIQYTPEERRQIMLSPLDADHRGSIEIGSRDAVDCEGVECGARLEAALSAEDLECFHDTHPVRSPMPGHSHMVVRGVNPETPIQVFAVLKE